MSEKEIETTARALITDGEKILLCQSKKGGYYYLPGGHVEFGESLRASLTREIGEELGVSGTVGEMIGIFENIYEEEGRVRHETNIIFLATLEKSDVESKEDHISFDWIDKTELSNANLLPKGTAECISNWLDDKKIFFGSNLHANGN